MKIKSNVTSVISSVVKGKLYDVVDKYSDGYLICNDDGLKTKIHRNNCEVINGHPHAELIMKYAEIAQYDAEPWKHFEYHTVVGWVECSPLMSFNETVEYRLKPRTININGFEVPEPLRSVPKLGCDYFIVRISEIGECSWDGISYEHQWLKAGIIHLTREAAEKHLEALLSFTKE